MGQPRRNEAREPMPAGQDAAANDRTGPVEASSEAVSPRPEAGVSGAEAAAQPWPEPAAWGDGDPWSAPAAERWWAPPGTSAPSAEPAKPAVPWPPVPPLEDTLSAVQRDAASGIVEPRGLIGQVVEVLRDIYDPEIPVNIYDLGLIYDVRELEPGRIFLRMTLTSPMCPVAESLPPEVRRRVEKVAGVQDALVDITWDPPWGPDKMSEAARLQLNMFY